MRKRIAFKPYSKEDKDLIIQLWNENHSAKDIAEVTDRTAASISQFIYTERKKGNPKLGRKEGR